MMTDVKHGVTVWFTGLSGAGKTTISTAVEKRLRAAGGTVECLDGDVVRKNLTKGLGFSKADRDENIRRIGFVAHLLSRNGVIVLVSAISPYRDIRQEVRERVGHFLEVYVNAPLEICEERDVKGLYAKARNGQLPGFTGIDYPYEPPLNPEVECRTDLDSLEECVGKVMEALEAGGYLDNDMAIRCRALAQSPCVDGAHRAGVQRIETVTPPGLA
jgi:adenylylsulfate kinase